MIHKEGYITILIVVLFIILVNWLYFHFLGEYKIPGYILQLGSLFLLILVLQFFRDPKRHVVENPYVVLSPADGEVVAIEEVEEPEYFKDKRIQVSVFMSVWNVHINWFPTKGRIAEYVYHPGDYLVARHPKSSTHNERTSVVITRPDGYQVLVRQIAGAVARRIVCYAKEQQAVEQCSEMGFIKFGSRVDVFLPLSAKVQVELGQKVKGCVTHLAQM